AGSQPSCAIIPRTTSECWLRGPTVDTMRPGVCKNMDAEAVLATARSDNVPSEWNVWPLHKDRVKRSVLNWAIIGVIGLVLFIGAVVATVPDNFTRGNLAIVATSFLLLVLATMAFGGLGIAIY